VAADDRGRPDRRHARELVRHAAADIDYAFPNLRNWSAGQRNVGFI
jgi:hypothetical protein